MQAGVPQQAGDQARVEAPHLAGDHVRPEDLVQQEDQNLHSVLFLAHKQA